jgi:dihydropteroate synthase
MGVLNANDDSFYEGSRFTGDAAVARIEEMIAQGADMIDVGAVSSRPGAAPVTPREEMARLRPLLEAIRTHKLYENALFSIDSHTPEAVQAALESGFVFINDITGARDERLVDLAVRYDAHYCIMHMQGTPQTMQQNPSYEDVTAEVSAFFAERIAACEARGLKRERIVLDVGIGFGKKLEHNLELLRNLSHFRSFGCEVLVGASRKSMIDRVIPAPVEKRLPGTLAIHLKAVQEGASIVRCHDVAEHKQALELYKAIEGIPS